MRRFAICFVFLVLCFLVVDAHDTWLMPTAGWVSEGDTSIVQLTEGHHAVPEGTPPGNINISVVNPNGVVTDMGIVADGVVDDNTMTNGPYYYIDFDVNETGLYVAKAEHHEGALTFVRTTFGTEYEEMGPYETIDWSSVDKTNWDNDWYIVEAYDDVVKFSKTFFVVNNSDFASASAPVGQKLEIVPLGNITTIGTGDFQFQVLFEGEPCSGSTVTAMKAYCEDIEGTTDDEGKVTLNLPEKGEWLIKTYYKDVVKESLLQHGPDSIEDSDVGIVYYHVLTLRSDYEQPEAS
ncbi:MAG: DUF4198 domain-containing protein [Methanotrichaceae archaeon]